LTAVGTGKQEPTIKGKRDHQKKGTPEGDVIWARRLTGKSLPGLFDPYKKRMLRGVGRGSVSFRKGRGSTSLHMDIAEKRERQRYITVESMEWRNLNKARLLNN